jgi:anti-sigma factor RsiW
MPMTEKTKLGSSKSAFSKTPAVLQDERIAAMVSAYLDGELRGVELEEFKTLLDNNEALAREVTEMQRIDSQLTELGADILSEPIPPSLLRTISKLERR